MEHDRDPWTLAEGVRDVLVFLSRRAAFGIALWAFLSASLSLWANAGSIAGELSAFTIMIAFFCLGAGVPVGAVFSRGLNKAVRFAGWVPSLLAGAASILAIVIGALLSHSVVPLELPMHNVLLPVFAGIGSCAAVARFTWADV